MNNINNIKEIDAFFELLRAGLWGQEARLVPYNDIDYSLIFQLALKQSVIGLIAEGMEHLQDMKAPRDVVLKFIGQTLQIEQQNILMNSFISSLVEKMRLANIHTLLVKGQGIAQCYERPLWRCFGDIDFFMDEENYRKADELLTPMSSYRKLGGHYSKEIGLGVESWTIELHASLRTGLSTRIDREIDAVQKDTFRNKKVRIWKNGETEIPLPNPDNDVFFVFTHFIKHFYKERMTLRQICDWCRLLWTYKEDVDVNLLDQRLKRAGLRSEWQAFAALAVDSLGMPVGAMPLYDADARWSKKGRQILKYIIDETTSSKFQNTFSIVRFFPRNTLLFLPSIIFNVNWMKIIERFTVR